MADSCGIGVNWGVVRVDVKIGDEVVIDDTEMGGVTDLFGSSGRDCMTCGVDVAVACSTDFGRVGRGVIGTGVETEGEGVVNDDEERDVKLSGEDLVDTSRLDTFSLEARELLSG